MMLRHRLRAPMLAVLAVLGGAPVALAGPTITTGVFSGNITNNSAPFAIQNFGVTTPMTYSSTTNYTRNFSNYDIAATFGGASGTGIVPAGSGSPFPSAIDSFFRATPITGSIILVYQMNGVALDSTTYDFIWGNVSVNSLADNSTISFNNNANSIIAGDIANQAYESNQITATPQALWVEISGLQPFNTVTFANENLIGSTDFAFLPGEPVPEPGSLLLLGSALLGLVVVLRRKRVDTDRSQI